MFGRFLMRSSRSSFVLSKFSGAAFLLGFLALTGCSGSSGDLLSGAIPIGSSSSTLQSIEITPANPRVAAGTSMQMAATGIYSDNSHADVTTQVSWSASNTALATVGAATGMARALSAGSVTLSASLQGHSASTTLTVTAATLVSIEITPPNPRLAAGTSTQLAATGIYSDNSHADVTTQVAWNTSNMVIATVGAATGEARALSVGAATLSASLQGHDASTTLTVTAATLVAIAVTPPTPNIALGLTQQFIATGTFTDNSTQNLTTSVTWASAATSVATISNASGTNGLATSTTVGTSGITAALGGVTSPSVALTVTGATLVSIAITPPTPSIVLGLTQQFVATGTYTNNTTQDLTTSATWVSATPAVATISNATGSNGLATSATAGTSSITAAVVGITSPSVPLTVTAATLVSIAITPPAPSIALGLTQQFIATGTYTDNSTQNLTTAVTWASATPAVATISNASGTNGLATSATLGTSNITATAIGITSPSVALTVTAATLVSIGITPPAPSIVKGTTQQFTATGIYTNNSTQNLTTSVTWASATPSVATISNAGGTNGLATSATAGTSSITAATVGITSPAVTLTVTPPTLVSITVTPSAPSIVLGTTQQFTATGSYSDSSTQNLTTSVVWASATPAVATISNAGGTNGLATSATAGTSSITAALGAITSPGVTLTVTPATLVSIAITPPTPSIPLGLAQQFVATGTYSNNTTQNLTTSVTWLSATPAVATISNAGGTNGLATSATIGTSSITAAVSGITSPAVTLTVTPAALVSITVTSIQPNIPLGTIRQLTATGTYTDNSTQNLTSSAAWMTSPTGILAISSAAGTQGEGTGLATGTTSVSASLGAVTSALLSVNVVIAQYAYVVNYVSNTVSEYTVGAAGALSANGTISTGSQPRCVAVDPSGRYVYVGADSGMYQYTILPSGALSPMSTVFVPGVADPDSVAVDPTGRYVYAANPNGYNVWQYTIGPGGALTAMTPNSVPTGAGNTDSLTIDPTGRYVYVSNSIANVVSQYTIGAGGALSAMNPPTVGTGTTPGNITLDASGSYAYVANTSTSGGGNSVSQYTIGAGGALNPMNPATAPAGTFPTFVTAGPRGPSVYALLPFFGELVQCTIGAGGAVGGCPGTLTTGSSPYFITLDPTGRFAYVLNNSAASVSEYALGTGGALSSIGSIATGTQPQSMAVSD